ncbi:MAG TPA: DinB family protein [Coriobacteriia bacterium]
MTADETAQVTRAQADDDRPAADLVAEYLRGAQRLREAVDGMDAAALRARPIEGAMSSLEVLCHVADCEQFLADRMKRTAGTERPLLLGIDASTYLEALNYHDRDPVLELELVDVTRRQMAGDLARLDAAAWSRTAVHSETGLVTLRQLLLHAIRHLDHHIGTIAEKRRALRLA